MSFELPELPYSRDALEPLISSRTLDFHHGKHHRGYINKLNKAIADTPYADLSLEEIVVKASEQGDTAVFNNAAQAWNHEFLWHSYSPDGGGRPGGALAGALEASFGSYDDFRDKFTRAATGQFGSGWAWLIADGGSLKIESTSNADTPIARGAQALITLDVWEHAYYLDHQNDRAGYVEGFLDDLINWSFAASNYQAVRAAA